MLISEDNYISNPTPKIYNPIKYIYPITQPLILIMNVVFPLKKKKKKKVACVHQFWSSARTRNKITFSFGLQMCNAINWRPRATRFLHLLLQSLRATWLYIFKCNHIQMHLACRNGHWPLQICKQDYLDAIEHYTYPSILSCDLGHKSMMV